jgi:hypothetical protein
MTFEEAKILLPNADYIYFDVTDEETDLAKDHRYIAYTSDNKMVLGAAHIIEELTDKLLVAPEEVTGSSDEVVSEEVPVEEVPVATE